MKIIGIYLAAGNSRRMGENKLALPVGTKTLGSLALETALKTSLDKIYLITQGDVNWLPTEYKTEEKVTIVQCPTAFKGQSESLRCGIKQAQAEQANAAIVILGDQPFITALMIEKMIICLKENPSRKFIATSSDGTITPPVLFSSALYPALLNLTGDNGARKLLQGELLTEGKLLPCADKRLVFDVDTAEDYDKLLYFSD